MQTLRLINGTLIKAGPGAKRPQLSDCQRGDVIGTLEQNGKTLNLYSPLSGRIKKRNRKTSTAGVAPADIYESSWLYKIYPENWSRDSSRLMFAHQAREWVQSEYERLRDFFAFSTQKYGMDGGLVALQDGGDIIDEALKLMPAEIWQEFQAEFIDVSKSS